MMDHFLKALSLALLAVSTASCVSSDPLTHSHVAYQSVTTRHAQPKSAEDIPSTAKIAVIYTISSSGVLSARVVNRTDQVMTIDQTKSFFVNSDGQSISYYDPTVRTTSTTDISSSTRGGSVNLGAIAGALGIGGPIGALAGGINVGGSGTEGTSTTNTTYKVDLPQVSVGPHGSMEMSKAFTVSRIANTSYEGETLQPHLTEQQSYSRFSVSISYSIDEGKTFQKLTTNFYADSKVILRVKELGQLNTTLRQLLTAKSDAMTEPWWLLTVKNKGYSETSQVEGGNGFFLDYQ